MPNSPPLHGDARRSRYEFRVWGEFRKSAKLLARLADEEFHEVVEDCYLLTDDLRWNAKVRDNTLKVKQLVEQDKGFERWSSERLRSSKAAPSPFDQLFEDLKLDRPQRGKSYDIEEAVRKLDPKDGVRAVFVTKNRHRFRLGDVRAEVTEITIEETNEVYQTLSFQGDDLSQLVELRKRLGVKGEPNVAVHQHIETELT